MDLSQLDCTKQSEEGAVLELLSPKDLKPVFTDEDPPQKMWIKLQSLDSKDAIAAQHQQAVARAEATDDEFGVDYLIQEEVELYARLTKDWHIQIDGQMLPCTRENAEALYLRFKWIRDVVKVFVSRRKHYLGNA